MTQMARGFIDRALEKAVSRKLLVCSSNCLDVHFTY